MNLVVLAAYDKKARAYLHPFYAVHVDVGTRNFASAVNDAKSDHPITKNPEDFALYQLGSWDDASGLFTLLGSPVHLVEAVQLKKGTFIDVPAKIA